LTGRRERNKVELARWVWEEGGAQVQEEGESEKHPAGDAKQLRSSKKGGLNRDRSTRTSTGPNVMQSRLSKGRRRCGVWGDRRESPERMRRSDSAKYTGNGCRMSFVTFHMRNVFSLR
jgi:hypothetical protein